MAVRVLTNKRVQRRNLPVAAISAKLRRLTLNKHAVALLVNEYGKTPDYGQILVDDEQEGIFWVRPAEADQEGTNKFDSPSPNTRSLHIGNLLRVLGWALKDTARFELSWDKKVGGGRVDTSKRLDQDKT
jgi:hypothetical protein